MKKHIFKIIILMTAFLILSIGCGAQKEKLGGAKGLFIEEEGNGAYRFTEEGLFQRGTFDKEAKVFTVLSEYVYTIKNGEILLYEMKSNGINRDDWNEIGGYWKVKNNMITPHEGYMLYNGNYTTDESLILAHVNINSAKAIIEGDVTGVSDAGNQYVKDEEYPEEELNIIKTLEGVWIQKRVPPPQEDSHGVTLASFPVGILFQNGMMYMGNGDTAEEIYEEAMWSYSQLGIDGFPFRVEGNRIIIDNLGLKGDEKITEWRFEGTNIWIGESEYDEFELVTGRGVFEMEGIQPGFSASEPEATDEEPVVDTSELRANLIGTWNLKDFDVKWQFLEDGTFIESVQYTAFKSASGDKYGTYQFLSNGNIEIKWDGYDIVYSVTKISKDEYILKDKYNMETHLYR